MGKKKGGRRGGRNSLTHEGGVRKVEKEGDVLNLAHYYKGGRREKGKKGRRPKRGGRGQEIKHFLQERKEERDLFF